MARQTYGVLFETLEILIDEVGPEAGGGPTRRLGAAMNMAVDEVLLRHAHRPILRVYGWARPAVSYGYFEAWSAVAAKYPPPSWDLVRRWTGGGVVPHGGDWTYSVIVPRDESFARLNAGESYRILHELLATAMSDDGVAGNGGTGVSLTPEAAAKVSQACFENPAQHDLLVRGQKIAGAAQRRSRFGLLHQGSVQGIAVPDDLLVRFARTLTREAMPARSLNLAEFAEAEELARGKYATKAWNTRY